MPTMTERVESEANEASSEQKDDRSREDEVLSGA